MSSRLTFCLRIYFLHKFALFLSQVFRLFLFWPFPAPFLWSTPRHLFLLGDLLFQDMPQGGAFIWMSGVRKKANPSVKLGRELDSPEGPQGQD